MTIRLVIFISSFTAGFFVQSWMQDGENRILKSRIAESEKKIEELKLRTDKLKNHMTSAFENADKMRAEELLAKIVQVFLADLSLRLSLPQNSNLPAQAIHNNAKTAQNISLNATAKEPHELSAKDPSQEVNAAKKPFGVSEEIQQFERRILNSRSDKEAFDYLRKMQVGNFFDIISLSKPVNSKSIQFLNGKFNGYINPAKAGQPAIVLDVEVELQSQSDPVKGTTRIIESRDGKVFSRSNGSGALKSFSIADNSTMLIVEHNGGDNYMQLYYSKHGDFFVGNDYEKSSPTQYLLSGRVFLQRAP